MQLILKKINGPQLIVSHDLESTTHGDNTFGSTSKVTTFKLSKSIMILFDSKPDKAWQISIPLLYSNIKYVDNNITINIRGINVNDMIPRYTFLYMDFLKLSDSTKKKMRTLIKSNIIPIDSINIFNQEHLTTRKSYNKVSLWKI